LGLKQKDFLKLSLFTLFFVGLIAAWLGFGERGFIHLQRMEKERQAHLEKIHRLERENQDLLDEVQRLRTDREYIELMGRRELGLIKEGEALYRFSRQKESADPVDSGKNGKQ